MKSTNLKGTLILVLVALIWGTGFVAQDEAANHLGAFAFNATRNLLATGFVLGLLWWRNHYPSPFAQPTVKLKLSSHWWRLIFRGKLSTNWDCCLPDRRSCCGSSRLFDLGLRGVCGGNCLGHRAYPELDRDDFRRCLFGRDVSIVRSTWVRSYLFGRLARNCLCPDVYFAYISD